jgi:hypothetical protein
MGLAFGTWRIGDLDDPVRTIFGEFIEVGLVDGCYFGFGVNLGE